MVDKSKWELGEKRVAGIIESRTFAEIKTAALALLEAADEESNAFNGALVWDFCSQLTHALSAWAEPYAAAPRGSKFNVVIVPPEHGPLMLLKSFLAVDGSPSDIINGLKKFIDHCDDYEPPMLKAITGVEIARVLNAAQKAYRLIDIIASKEPLKIIRFDYSHMICDSQCALPDRPDQPATLMLFHPRRVDGHNRVFIFAHELGHALHQALTGDVDATPDGFEEFLKSVSAKKWDTVSEMQEYFADAAAIAILSVKGLGAHFPSRLIKAMSPIFARFLRKLCESALKKSRAHAGPPPPI